MRNIFENAEMSKRNRSDQYSVITSDNSDITHDSEKVRHLFTFKK